MSFSDYRTNILVLSIRLRCARLNVIEAMKHTAFIVLGNRRLKPAAESIKARSILIISNDISHLKRRTNKLWSKCRHVSSSGHNGDERPPRHATLQLQQPFRMQIQTPLSGRQMGVLGVARAEWYEASDRLDSLVEYVYARPAVQLSAEIRFSPCECVEG